MNTNEHNNSIQNVLDRIESHNLKPRTRMHFRLRLALLIVLSVAVVVVSVFLASYILFGIRARGQASLIGFGSGGTGLFLVLFPWKLFVLDIILAVLLQWLLRQFKFGYHMPVLYLGAMVLLIVGATGVIADELHVHDRLMRYGEDHLDRPIQQFYVSVRVPQALPSGHDIYQGIVLNVGSTSLLVRIDDPRTSTTTIVDVKIPAHASSSFRQGERLFFSGELVEKELNLHDYRRPNPADRW